MGHEYVGCTDADCQLCAAFVEGAQHGQATLARTLRHVRDHGSFPPDVGAIKSCAEPCEHDYCALVTTLGWLYFHVSKHLDGINADLWEKNNPHLAEQLRDALRSDDDAKDGELGMSSADMGTRRKENEGAASAVVALPYIERLPGPLGRAHVVGVGPLGE